MLELLQGENVAAVRAALGRLGCWTDQGQNGGRVSLSSLKHTLGQLNLVTVLTSKDAHEFNQEAFGAIARLSFEMLSA